MRFTYIREVYPTVNGGGSHLLLVMLLHCGVVVEDWQKIFESYVDW